LGAGSKMTEALQSEQAKRENAFPAANASVNNITQNASELLRDLEALKNHPGRSNITGLTNGANTPNISADARNAVALLDRIKSQGTLSTLNALRAASEGTGASGLRITNKDVGLLEQAFGTLNPSQSTTEMKKSIQNAIDKIKNITGNVTQEFNDKYAYRGAKAPTLSTPTAPGVDTSNPWLK
jgi:predicted trehalose synthase